MRTLDELEARHAEWAPWLSVIRVVLAEIDEAHWDTAAPCLADSGAAARLTGGSACLPLIARHPLPVDAALVRRWFEQLRLAAIRSELPKLLGWNDALSSERNALAVFAAALRADEAQLAKLASSACVEPDAFAAVAALLPIPFLQACRRAWMQPAHSAWKRYCPCCGAWPVCVEVCGIERSRYLRCVRCAASWHNECLRCAFCGNADHEQLGSLQAEAGMDLPALDVCDLCKGYIKVFNRLAPSQPAALLLSDLASVELDVAAADRGYRRPSGVGCDFAVSNVP